eukprot:6461239-Amphidinium_carterae.1
MWAARVLHDGGGGWARFPSRGRGRGKGSFSPGARNGGASSSSANVLRAASMFGAAPGLVNGGSTLIVPRLVEDSSDEDEVPISVIPISVIPNSVMLGPSTPSRVLATPR